MAESRYEKYIIRKPTVRGKNNEVVETDKLDVKGKPDTGPIIWWCDEMVKGSRVLIESGIISGELLVGTGLPGSFKPHRSFGEPGKKTDVYGGEFFVFLGTNPDDPMDLGAEAEFYLGEGEDLEKVDIKTSACVWVEPGVAHFPLRWKNVKRPVMFIVFDPNLPPDKTSELASMEGRPTE